MNIYFTSDLHFGHKNVIPYCNRPYKDLEEMHEAIITIWNETVKEGDTVYVLGDFSLNKRWSQDITPLLNGNKILISGNHDDCFKHPRKETSGLSIQQYEEKCKRKCNEYLQHGWKEIHQSLTLQLKDGSNVLLSHLPYSPKEGEVFDKRYLNLRPKDNLYQILLHGHLHCKYRKWNRMIDVGFDGDYKLWSEDEILGLINDDRDIIESPITEWYKQKNDIRNNMKG